ncbi:MAG: cupredoxin domain-containing protein [Bdellovibrionales bacterium]
MRSFLVAIMFALNLQPALAQVKDQVVELQVTEKGFEPSTLDVKTGIPVVLKIIRKTDSTCATQIKMQSKKIKKELPLNKTVTIALGKLDKGEIRFGCGMDMITGYIIVQ